MYNIDEFMKRAIAIIIIFVILAFIFYWFQIRPENIRKECEAYVGSKYDLKNSFYLKRANNAYRDCLVQRGLKPESLLVNIK